MSLVEIPRRERLRRLAGATLLSGLLSLPYLLGYWLSDSGTVFTGTIMNPEDSQSYFAKMLQGYDGRWLYRIPFTSEAHQPAFVGGFYLAAGHIARWFGLSLPVIWQTIRVVCGVLMFLAASGFVASHYHEIERRRVATLLAWCGSGLGWLLFILGKPFWLGAFPVDFKMPEAHLFFTGLTFPHIALSSALLMLEMALISQMAGHRNWKSPVAVLAGVVNVGLGILYPYLIFLVLLTAGLFWLAILIRRRVVNWRFTGGLAIAFLIPAPLNVYYLLVNRSNEIFRAWAENAATPSPPWPHYLVAYGPYLLLAFLPLWPNRRSESMSDRRLLLWLWLAAATVFLFGPLNAQRRFVLGIQVPLAVLATDGLFKTALPNIRETRSFQWIIARPRYSREGMERLLLTTFLLLMALGNMYILADVSVTAAFYQPYPLFRPASEFDAIEWLRTNTGSDAVILGAGATGNLVAAQSGNRVVAGHWAETNRWEIKQDQIERFFSTGTSDIWRREFLEEQGVSFVWYGPQERKLGNFDPGAVDFLTVTYSNSNIIIYKTTADSDQ